MLESIPSNRVVNDSKQCINLRNKPYNASVVSTLRSLKKLSTTVTVLASILPRSTRAFNLGGDFFRVYGSGSNMFKM